MSVQDNDAETMYLCTERATRRIFETKYFEEHVLVRPADPRLYYEIRYLDYPAFAREFEEFGGSYDQVRCALMGDVGVTVLN